MEKQTKKFFMIAGVSVSLIIAIILSMILSNKYNLFKHSYVYTQYQLCKAVDSNNIELFNKYLNQKLIIENFMNDCLTKYATKINGTSYIIPEKSACSVLRDTDETILYIQKFLTDYSTELCSVDNNNISAFIKFIKGQNLNPNIEIRYNILNDQKVQQSICTELNNCKTVTYESFLNTWYLTSIIVP